MSQVEAQDCQLNTLESRMMDVESCVVLIVILALNATIDELRKALVKHNWRADLSGVHHSASPL